MPPQAQERAADAVMAKFRKMLPQEVKFAPHSIHFVPRNGWKNIYTGIDEA